MTPHRRPVHCKIVRSVVVPDMMSLEVLGVRPNPMRTFVLDTALTANFEEGDEVVITLVEKKVDDCDHDDAVTQLGDTWICERCGAQGRVPSDAEKYGVGNADFL